MSDIGKYIKPLIISSMVYVIVGASYDYSMAEWITPPPSFGLETISWFFGVVLKIIWSAFTVMTFPMIPNPFRFLLSIVFGTMFLYGLIGTVYHIIKIIKPFGG